MKLRVYPSREALMAGLAEVIAGELRAGLAAGPVTLSVPGGATPGPVFDALNGVDLDWSRVAVVLNDERWVGEDSDRSNTRLLRERLLQRHAANAKVLPLYAPVATPEEGLAMLAAGIAPHLPITVLLLGMGGDMHTASLFPGADRLVEALAPDAPVWLRVSVQLFSVPFLAPVK